MLPELLVPFAEQFQVFNLFRYLTFRTGGAILTALVIGFLFGPFLIKRMRRLQRDGDPIREDGPESHFRKRGTPTMGGVLILVALGVSTVLWADLSSGYVWTVLFVTLGFGLVGFADDFLKVSRRNSRGLSARLKLIPQIAIALVAILLIIELAAAPVGLSIPFVKDVVVDLGWFFIPFAMIVVVGASNAVNLTDGLDGLATVPVIIACGCFALIAYLTGNIVFAQYLQLHHVPGAGELAVFSGALIGAGLSFLWYNCPPAAIFMGDTGSLAMGGALGTISVITRHELVLAIIGGLFVLETVSVIVQVASFRLVGRRVLRMAPIHHHFEQIGWPETTVVVRFWIIAVVLALIGLSTLKLR